MNEAEARTILGAAIQPDNSIEGGGYPYGDRQPIDRCVWRPGDKNGWVYMDGTYTLPEMQALVWWMENMGKST